MGDCQQGAVEIQQGILKHFAGGNVEVIGGFIQKEEVGARKGDQGDLQPGALSARERPDRGIALFIVKAIFD